MYKRRARPAAIAHATRSGSTSPQSPDNSHASTAAVIGAWVVAASAAAKPTSAYAPGAPIESPNAACRPAAYSVPMQPPIRRVGVNTPPGLPEPTDAAVASGLATSSHATAAT